MKTRRDFLLFGFFGISGLLFTALPSFISKKSEKKEIIKQTHFAMGTLVSFIISHPSKEEARQAIALAIEEIHRLEKIFSRHDPNSALSTLNTHAKLTHAPKELVAVLEESLTISHKTNSVYNPAIKPLLDLFEAHQDYTQSAKNIDPFALKEAKKLTNTAEIRIEKNTLSFNQEGMGISLDSLAKGYIIDKASELLLALNIQNHVINAGGDIIAKGTKEHAPWIIGVEDPKYLGDPTKLLSQFPLKNQAIATSGSYQRYFDKEKKRHHIIDPRTGTSPELFSITCKAQSAMQADAYATVCSLVPYSKYENSRIV